MARTAITLFAFFCPVSDCAPLAHLSAAEAEIARASFLIGRRAPDFVVSTLDGRRVAIRSYRGKAVLVNFWATWCGNCRLEMPWLARLREKYAAQGFEVLGIVTDDAPFAKITSIAQKYGVKYPILGCNHATAQAYGGLPDLPESFFIDRQGRIVAETEGADSQEQIEANIQKALQH
jgi:thiol-disulfide isomerase/thioredoxin